MRIWDCHPLELARQHLVSEWNELHTVFRAVVAKRWETGNYGYGNHPETLRFANRGDGLALLVARGDYLVAEGTRRGYSFTAPLEATGLVGRRCNQDSERLWVPEEVGGWYDFVLAVNWPMLDMTAPAYPWTRDDVTYEHYRLRGRYADGRHDLVADVEAQ